MHELDSEDWPPTTRAGISRSAEVHVNAAALYASMLKHGFFDEAVDFAEWYLETFDHDLED